MNITIETELEGDDYITIEVEIIQRQKKTAQQIFSFVETIFRAVKEADNISDSENIS